MKNLAIKLKACSLFQHLDEQEIMDAFLSIDYKIKNFTKNEIVAYEEDTLSNIGIIIDGQVQIQKIYPSAKTITIAKMTIGDVFGEVLIFSNAKFYPATIISSTISKIIFISKENILKLCKLNITFLENLMSLLSNKMLLLNNKLTLLSHKTIKAKISAFLISEYEKQHNLIINLHSSKKLISEQMGITRPSFSRELIKMKKEGLIDYDMKTITILNLQLLENILL